MFPQKTLTERTCSLETEEERLRNKIRATEARLIYANHYTKQAKTLLKGVVDLDTYLEYDLPTLRSLVTEVVSRLPIAAFFLRRYPIIKLAMGGPTLPVARDLMIRLLKREVAVAIAYEKKLEVKIAELRCRLNTIESRPTPEEANPPST